MITCFRTRKEIMAGEVVFRGEEVSEQNRKLFIIVKGEFSKCKKNLSGELMAFKTLREGDIFGEENLHVMANLEYTVLCTEDNSEVAYMEKNAF